MIINWSVYGRIMKVNNCDSLAWLIFDLWFEAGRREISGLFKAIDIVVGKGIEGKCFRLGFIVVAAGDWTLTKNSSFSSSSSFSYPVDIESIVNCCVVSRCALAWLLITDYIRWFFFCWKFKFPLLVIHPAWRIFIDFKCYYVLRMCSSPLIIVIKQ